MAKCFHFIHSDQAPYQKQQIVTQWTMFPYSVMLDGRQQVWSTITGNCHWTRSCQHPELFHCTNKKLCTFFFYILTKLNISELTFQHTGRQRATALVRRLFLVFYGFGWKAVVGYHNFSNKFDNFSRSEAELKN